MSSWDVPLWYVPDPCPPQDRLTFGVEIEVALASLPPGSVDPNPEDTRVCYGINDGPFTKRSENARHHIAQNLQEAGIQAEYSPGTDDKTYEYDYYWQPKDPRSWAIKMDEDIDDPEDAGDIYQWHDIELNSPPLYYSEDAIKEVMYVLEFMSSTYRCALTRRTALHVHVGNAAKGFDPVTVQKLLATYWTFEPQIELIHPLFRIDYENCASLRRGSDLALSYTLPKSQRNDQGYMFYLLGTQNRDILKLESHTRHPPAPGKLEDRSAVNIQPLAEAQRLENKGEKTTKKTIEFRQHTSTLDPQELAHWIRLLVGLVEFADTVEYYTLHDFLEEHVAKTVQQCRLHEALIMLGMPREAEYFRKVAFEMNRKKVLSRRKPDSWVLTGKAQDK